MQETSINDIVYHMSEHMSLSVGQLQPGDVIEFGDLREVPTFEDMVAVSIDDRISKLFPERTNVLNLSAWAGRTAIRELISPPKFHGTIANVRLDVMEEPYERLIDARERGWKFQRGASNFQRTSDDALSVALLPEYRGFVLSADAKSSGRGTVGQIVAELWYAPVPFDFHNASSTLNQRTSLHGGSSVFRVITSPRLEKDNFYALNEESREIAFQVLRRNMKHPLVQPMRD